MTRRSKRDMDQRDHRRRRPWTSEEDGKLRIYVSQHGARDWKTVAQKLDIGKSGNSCRLRWFNYLSPDIVRGNITDEEWILILKYHAELGNKWSQIAKMLKGRTDNEIKNFWNTRVKKEAKLMGPEMIEKISMARRIETAAVPPPTITAVIDANLFSPLSPPAVAGGSGSNTVQQFGDHDSPWNAPYEDQLANYSWSTPPPAVAGGSIASIGATVGYSGIGDADLYPYESWSAQQWGYHGSTWSDHAHLSAPLPPPAVAGGNSSFNPDYF